MMSQWVKDEISDLMGARHSQDMGEGQRLGHNPNLSFCVREGECRKLYLELKAVVDK